MKITPAARKPRRVEPPRRRNPLATVLVMVVLTSVIATSAGIAFGR